MSVITGYDHFTNNGDLSKQVVAPKTFWIKYCLKNISGVVKIIIENTADDKCVICSEGYSKNFDNKSALFSHYRNHGLETVEYYLNNLVSKPLYNLQVSGSVTK